MGVSELYLRLDIISALIKNGADAKAQDKGRLTALMLASENEYLKDTKAYRQLKAANQ
jgi:ankyrin repeat protein